MFLSQSCSVFVSCDISTVTVLIRGSRELPCCNLCFHSKRTCIVPSSCVALSLDSYTPAAPRRDCREGTVPPHHPRRRSVALGQHNAQSELLVQHVFRVHSGYSDAAGPTTGPDLPRTPSVPGAGAWLVEGTNSSSLTEMGISFERQSNTARHAVPLVRTSFRPLLRPRSGLPMRGRPEPQT